MIFVTVGTARDFSRLIKKVDEIAGRIKDEVIAQRGWTKYKPRNCKYFEFVSRDQFLEYIKRADIIITHGGVGTIINCLKCGKATIVVPRRKKYNEHRNDHQIDIAKELECEGRILACYDVKNLEKKISKAKTLKIKSEISQIRKALENFIEKK